MTIARWDNGLSLNFIDADFRGWVSSDPDLPVDGGFMPGQARVDMPSGQFPGHVAGQRVQHRSDQRASQ
jgi:hypothetical protein